MLNTQEGKVLELIAPAGGVVTDGLYKIGNLIVAALGAAAAGASFRALTECLVENAIKQTGVAVTQTLCAAYFNPTTRAWSPVHDASNYLGGVFVGTYGSSVAVCSILLTTAIPGGNHGSSAVDFEKASAPAAPVYSAVDPSTQTGDGSMTCSGSGAKRAGHVTVEITTQGAPGIAVFKWKIGDETDVENITTGASIQLGTTGIYCQFLPGPEGGNDSFEVGDKFEFDVSLEADCNAQFCAITANRTTPTLITDAIVVNNSRILATSQILPVSLPVAGTRTTGEPTFAGATCEEGKATIRYKNASLDAENGTSVFAFLVV